MQNTTGMAMMAAAFAIVASVTLFGKGERYPVAASSVVSSGGPVLKSASDKAPVPDQ